MIQQEPSPAEQPGEWQCRRQEATSGGAARLAARTTRPTMTGVHIGAS